MDLSSNMINQINMLYGKKYDPNVFSFDMLRGPGVYQVLPYDIIEYIHQYIIDPKNSGNTAAKVKHIDEVLSIYGFKRFASGTNRAVYGFMEDQSFCLKVALDKTGITNNPDELKNQELLKPFVCKIFDVSPCGTIATVERVLPIRSRQEFALNAGSIFDVVANKFVGKYILEDIGTIWFKNWGIRRGFGPVLLDYPYLYEVDLNDLFCNEPDRFGFPCGGQIDYDDGFNILYCTKCGKRHKAKQIGKAIENNSIRKTFKGGNSMEFKAVVKKGDKVIVDKTPASTSINPNEVVRNSDNFSNRPGSWKKEDFDVIITLNGIKIGKKGDQTTILGQSHAKATTLPSKDENPYKQFMTKVKTSRQPRNLSVKPEAPEWAKNKDDDDAYANRPGEKVTIKVNLTSFTSEIVSTKIDEKENNNVSVEEENVTEEENNIVEEESSDEDNEEVINESYNDEEDDSSDDDEGNESYDDETTDDNNEGETMNEKNASNVDMMSMFDDDLEVSDEENEKAHRELEKLRENQRRKERQRRNKVSKSYGFSEDAFDRTEDKYNGPDVSNY